MPIRKYNMAVCGQDRIRPIEDYRRNAAAIEERLLTKRNAETARQLTRRYATEARFLFRDANDRLLLFKTPPKEAIAGGDGAIPLPDDTMFPELKQGEYIDLERLAAHAGTILSGRRKR